MALGDILSSLAAAWLDQQKTKIYGPDYKEKQAMAQDTLAGSKLKLLEMAQKLRDEGIASAAETGAAQQEFPDMDPRAARIQSMIKLLNIERKKKELANTYLDAETQKALREPTARVTPEPHVIEGVRDGKPVKIYRDPVTGQERVEEQFVKPEKAAPNPDAAVGNPFPATDDKGQLGMWIRTKGGQTVRATDSEGKPLGVPPTTQQRDEEKLDVMLPVAIDSLQRSLDDVKSLGWTGGAASMVYGTDAFKTKEMFVRQAKALAVILGKGLGEQRMTDEDRRVYSNMYAEASRLAALPPSAQLSQKLLDNMKRLAGQLRGARQSARIPPALPNSGTTVPDSGTPSPSSAPEDDPLGLFTGGP